MKKRKKYEQGDLNAISLVTTQCLMRIMYPFRVYIVQSELENRYKECKVPNFVMHNRMHLCILYKLALLQTLDENINIP